MTLTTFAATAATCDIVPGTEQANDEGMFQITGQVFTDIIESQDARLAGTNTPILDILFNPESQDGELQGRFVLKPDTVDGTWEGAMQGRLVKGSVTAWGVARGSGALAHAVMRIDFQQVPEYPGQPPCENPQAFFEITGLILE